MTTVFLTVFFPCDCQGGEFRPTQSRNSIPARGTNYLYQGIAYCPKTRPHCYDGGFF